MVYPQSSRHRPAGKPPTHSLAHGAFVTVIWAAVDPGPARPCEPAVGGGGRPTAGAAMEPAPTGGTREYGIPGPVGPGILVACAHGAAVPAPPPAPGGGGIGMPSRSRLSGTS